MSDAAMEVEKDDAKVSEKPAAKEVNANKSEASQPEGGGHFFANMWTIAKRELVGYLNAPLAYIVICGTLLVVGVQFFLYQGGIWQVDRASMARMFQFIPGLLCFLTIPLFTMRSLSEEKRLGTIELLITMPVRDSEVILGKFVAALGMVSIQILLLSLYPIMMFVAPWHLGAFEWGPFWSGMLGLVLMSGAGCALGLMFSGFTDSQILSYFATAVALLALFFVGSVVELVRGPVGDVIAFFSFQSRFDPFARGVIDSRAILYFVSISVLCLLVAFRSLESRKWS